MKNLILVLIILSSTLISQETNYGDAFLNIGASSRSIGLGRSVVALPQNIGGYLINPAASGFMYNQTITGMYVNQFELAEYITLGYSRPTKRGYQWGIHAASLFVDDIFERPDLITIIDLETRRDSIRKLVAEGFNTFNTRESALIFNLSKNIKYDFQFGRRLATMPIKIPLGLNIKLLQKDLYNLTGTGIGVDMGGMAFMDLGGISGFKWLDYFSMGLSFNNLITTRIYWNSDKIDDIPMQVITGIGYFHMFDHFPIKYTILWQKNSLYKSDSQYGAEITLFDIVSIRGGFNYEYLQGGVGLMIGEKMNNFSIAIDYSFSNHDLGNAHRIGGTIYF